MSASDTVRLSLSGHPLPGFAPGTVIPALAALLKVNETQAAAMLAGRPTVIKRELPRTQLARYLDLLAGVGAEAWVEEAVAAPVAPAPAPRAAFAPQPVAVEEPVSAFPSLLAADTIAPAAAEVVRPNRPAPVPAPAPAPEVRPEPVDAAHDALEAALAMLPIESPPPAAAPAPLSLVGAEPQPELDLVVCPSCQLSQPRRTLCRGCGADMPRMLKAARVAREQPAPMRSAYGSSQVETVEDETETPPLVSLSFQGRIGRLRYLAWSLAFYIPMVVVLIVSAVLTSVFKGLGIVLAIAAMVAGVVFLLRLLAMRLHDLGLSAKWLLLMPASGLMLVTGSPRAALVVALLCWGMSFFLAVLPGQRDGNAYGPPPGPNSGAVIFGAVLCLLLSVGSAFLGGSGSMLGATKAKPSGSRSWIWRSPAARRTSRPARSAPRSMPRPRSAASP
ncbi:DUF805 domain-containing protein [Chitinimonas koreensis]|uniref:DUF805 domain-containing protein n=1 Tax=Chitinimonas koreensis TaxID=356302 RepID=UPI0016545FB4|nr:DUF805 domain-containing protein [Chitinimonas koreensis]QNM97323.1 DUF805 domain-containing protein [Chitinimonas koreensis]